MALIHEAGLHGNISDWQPCQKQLLRALNAQLNQVGVRRQPNRCTKDPQQVKWAEVNLLCKLFERDRLGDVLMQKGANLSNVGWLGCDRAQLVSGIGVADDQLSKHPPQA